MRLKEPLYGIRVAGMHWMFHLGLAITMVFTNSKEAMPLPPYCDHPRQKLKSSDDSTDLNRISLLDPIQVSRTLYKAFGG